MAALHRRTGITTVATLSALALAVGLTHTVAPEWSRTLGLDVWNAPSYEAQCRDNVIRSQDLDNAREIMSRHIEISDELARRWLAGEMSLRDAIAQLLEVRDLRPGFDVFLATGWPDASPMERLGLYLLAKARRQCEDSPSQAPVAISRLEIELHDLVHLSAAGTN
jgi:hypothetical protein